MLTSVSIAQQAVRILTYIDSTAQPGNAPPQDSTLTALYNLHRLFPSCVVVTCPVQHGNFFYISDNCEAVFGYPPEDMMVNMRQLANYIAEIHEADLADFMQCLIQLESIMKEQPAQDAHKIRAVFHYRFRHASGQYQYLQDEKASLLNADDSLVHYSLIRNMPPGIVFSGVKMELFKQDGTLQKIGEYKPIAHTKKLSSREQDLVVLIKKGLTTKEIAGQLSISQHTVRNIKSKLFEKYRVNNSIELLNKAG